jgi:hypothetical protein
LALERTRTAVAVNTGLVERETAEMTGGRLETNALHATTERLQYDGRSTAVRLAFLVTGDFPLPRTDFGSRIARDWRNVTRGSVRQKAIVLPKGHTGRMKDSAR